MFCKWCGGNIASSDTKCKRCGKEVPVLSDCGGFYDLVPNAKRTGAASAVNTRIPAVVSAETGRGTVAEPEQPKRKNGSRKLLVTLLIVTVACFVLTLMLLLTTVGKLNRLSNKLVLVEGQVKSISNAVDVLIINRDLPAEAPEEEKIPLLTEQELVFTVKQTEENAVSSVTADSDLGAYKDEVVVVYDFDTATGQLDSVKYSLEEADADLKLDFDFSSSFGMRSVSVTVETVADVFGTVEEDGETWQWQYRLDDGEWTDVDEEVFTQSMDAGKAELKIQNKKLKEMTEESKGAVELRCEIIRSNADGGSMKIIIEGIRLQTEKQEETQKEMQFMEGI